MITYFTVELEHAMTSDNVRGKDSLSSNGLTIERILSYSKWRITYNGLNYIQKPGNEHANNGVEPQHVTFTFLYETQLNEFHSIIIFTIILFIFSWTAASNPFSWPNNWGSKLLSRALGGVQQHEIFLNDL